MRLGSLDILLLFSARNTRSVSCMNMKVTILVHIDIQHEQLELRVRERERMSV